MTETEIAVARWKGSRAMCARRGSLGMYVAVSCLLPLSAAPGQDCGDGTGGEEPGRKVQFTTRRSYPLERNPLGVAYATLDLFARDMDGDGRTDIVLQDGAGEILVIQNRATRELSPPVRFVPDFKPPGVLVPGDYDRDGDVDVVVLNLYDQDPLPPPHEMLLLKNDGSGGLSPAGVFEVGEHPTYGTSADLDGDGDLDLAVSRFHQNKRIKEVSVVLNQGDGTFGPPLTVPAIWDQRHISAGDLNGDGLPEIVVGGRKDTPPLEGGLVAVIPNLGGGRFGEPKAYPVNHRDTVWALELGDMDGDGFLDVVEGSANSKAITILYNDGSGALTATSELKGNLVILLRLGDLDGDGRLDIVSRGGGVHRNLGGRAFAPPVFYDAGGGTELFDLGDFDADGALDLAVSANEFPLSVLYGRGDGRLDAAPVYSVASVGGSLDWAAGWIIPRDFDRDGDIDIAAAGVKSSNVIEYVTVLQNRGDGTFDFSPPYAFDKNPTDSDFAMSHMEAADLDGDGAIDLATCGNGNGYAHVGVLWNQGDGSFTRPDIMALALDPNRPIGPPKRIAAADFDGDGDLDLVTMNDDGRLFSFLWNLGARTFGEEQDISFEENDRPLFFHAADMAVLDHDRDGDPDILFLHAENGTEVEPIKLSVLSNDGARRFTWRRLAHLRGFNPFYLASIAAGDLDGDGVLEILVSAAQGPWGLEARGLVYVLGESEAGNLEVLQELRNVGVYLNTMNLVDMDLDGDLDLVTPGVHVFLNDGAGRLGEPTAYNVDYDPVVTAAGDFSGDGKMDLAVSCRNPGNVAILLNEAGSAGSAPMGTFRRGDVDASGSSDGLEDALGILIYLFEGGGQLACLKAADVDDDGGVRVTDPIYLLHYHFLDGPAPPAPFACCGLDPTTDSLPECRGSTWDCR